MTDDPFPYGGVWLGPDPGDPAPGRPANPRSPLRVVYEPAPPDPEPADEEERELEEELLRLCRQERAVFNRLLDHEWRRHPGSRKAALRLAVEHYRRDHR